MKMLSTFLLLSTLTLVNLQHVSLPRFKRDSNCLKSDLLQIKEFFKNTTIVRIEDTTDIKYCAFMDDESPNLLHTSMDLDTVIGIYTKLDYVNSYRYVDGQGPVIYDGALSINDEDQLPLYKVADIRKRHLLCRNTIPGFSDEVIAQVKLMNFRNTDSRGYLLSHSLGGDANVFNIIPMAVNVYWHQYYDTKYTDILGLPQAFWRSNEYWIRKFLLRFYPNGRVLWKIALQYSENVFMIPKRFRSYRPLSFSLQYVAYSNEYDDNSVYYESPLLTFRNDNHYSCKTVNDCHKDTTDAEQNPESNCYIDNAEPQGKIGSDILDEKDWQSRYVVAFPYYVKGKAYFYAQNQDLKWFINELLPDGKVGEQTAADAWNANYTYSFPYVINGTQYMYAHSNDDKSWFVRKLLPGGKMGDVTDKGTWDDVHWSCHYSSLNGKHYFLTQWPNKTLIVKELIRHGKIANINVSNRANSHSDPQIVHFAFHVNNSLVFLRHVQSTKHWNLYRFDNEMKFDVIQGENYWDYGYNVLFTYILRGKRFVYGLSADAPYHWFIRKMLPNGTLMDTKLSDDKETASYKIAFPFSINGRQYLYKQNKDTLKSQIQEFL